MELVKKSKKQCKKLKKLKQETPEKKLKIDTPCKGVDAKRSIQKKNNLICFNINKLNNKYKTKSRNNNSIKVFNNIRKKKLVVDKNFNEKSSALTENVKEETCNDKMTKVAAPVVKMVEPLLDLIDFEEEIKVEKISKDKNAEIKVEKISKDKSADIKFAFKNFDFEKEIEKNTIKNVENIKGKEKINIVSKEINSNSKSKLGENSSRPGIASENKFAIPRRNPSRRIFEKDERKVKTNIEKQNVQIVNKKRQSQKKLHSTLKNKNLPLTYKNSNQNTNTSVLRKKRSAKNENSPNSVSHVPTKIEGRSPSSISEKNVNTDEKNENSKLIEKLKNAKIIQNQTQNKKRESLRKGPNKAKIKVDKILEKEEIQDNQHDQKESDQKLHVKDESLSLNNCPVINSIMENEEIESTMEMNVDLNTFNEEEAEFKPLENTNNSPVINSDSSKNENQENELLQKDKEIKVEFNQNIVSEEISELISAFNPEFSNSKELEQSFSPRCNDLENLKSNEANVECEQNSNELNLDILSHKINEVVENEEKEQITCSHEEQQCPNNTDKEKEEKSIGDKSNLQLTETCLNSSTLIKERFFIFDEITEEENLKCQINSTKKQYINVDEKICGEIIYKTREEFSINCYICWDNDNWTFKKFNDLKLFSAHLNSKHSNDQINLQNQRGNSYSLDFVNENSCVMPQSMWFGIYNEMISLKCGFAKINSNGYILYSCLECKSNFKNFTSFTKHIVGREIKEKENENCSIRQDSPKPEKDSDLMSSKLFITCNNEKNDEKLNDPENGSAVALNSFTSCCNEENYQTITNTENGSNVFLKPFNSDHNENCNETVQNIKNDANTALKSIINCNNEKQEVVKNILEENIESELNLNLQNKVSSPKPKGILESILENSKIENTEKNQVEANVDNSSVVPLTNDSLENHSEVNEVKSEKSIENIESSCVIEESELKCDLDNLSRPDTYGYKNITSSLFRIFNNDQDESASTKLNKILSLGLNYRDIKEKEKLELEEKDKPKILLSSPKLEGLNISNKNILDLDDKLALLTCKYCNRRYTCVANLREHFRIHVGDRIVLCHVCKRGFSKQGNLDEHIKIFHIDTSDLQNIDLDELGENRKLLAKNTKITINENNPKEKGYKCQYCPRYLSNRAVLEDHLRLHLGVKPLNCEKCNLQFIKKLIYDNHIIEYHTGETQTSINNFENNSYDKENNKPFLNNMKQNQNRFKCKQCSQSYSTKIELIDHLCTHNNGEFKCSFCEQRFDSSKKRSYHEKLHKMNPKFECDICNKPFSNLYGLEIHQNLHKQNALYKCRFCDHYFALESTRNIHEDIHKNVSDTENLQIQTVDIATILQMNNEQAPISSNANTNDSNGTSSDGTDRTSSQNTTARNFMVKKIIKKIKRGKRDPNAPLDCRYCKKHFESPHQLSYHERLHEIGKKFQCNICEKIMATSYALELHLTAHLKKKNFRKGTFNNKFNGSAFLTNQPQTKIEIVSNVSLAPNQTMEILNSFFKRDIPSITVTTTSEDESFQKIGVDDIEKNLTAHVLRDTDPYYQLMADFSYQYQMYQNKSVAETIESIPTEVPVFQEEFNDITVQKSKRIRKKKINSEATEDTQNSVLPNANYMNKENNFEKQNENDVENQILQLTENKTSLEPDHNNKKKEKKRISPDVSKNITSVFIKCEYCNKKFNSNDKKSLNRHRRLHIAGDSHKCSFCNKCFATVYYLDKHLRVHHLKDVSEHKCKSCDLVYALKEALRRHEQRAHKEISSKAVILENQNNQDINEPQENIDQINYNENISMPNKTIDNNIFNENNDQNFAIPEIPKKSYKKQKCKELKPFDCDFCEKSFLTSNSLQTHVDRIHKKDAEDFEASFKYKCTYENCNKKFEVQISLEKHLRLHEAGVKCSMCGKRTMSQLLLDHHMKSHGLPTSYACKYCTSKFTMELSRNIHERKIHSKGSIYIHPHLIIRKLNMTRRKVSYRCYNCKNSFSSLILLKYHNMYKHTVFECNTCPAIFSRKNELEEHEKIHLKTLQCNICEKTFENKHTLYKHRRQHETKFFKCSMCPAEFSFRDELNEHKKNHDESERPFKCVEMGCDKGFIVETFLNTHLKKVHGYFLFNCDRCKREFLNEELLIQHRKEHEILASDKQYRCDQCFKDFSTLTILKIHQKLHQSSIVAAAAQTPESQKTSRLKLYTCEQCEKRFSIVTYLNNHLKKVHQVKLFVCEHCKMEFRNEKDLQEHSKVHLTGKKFIRVEKTHLDRPFKCELCGNSYAILAYLNNHLNKVHGDEETEQEEKVKNVQIKSKNFQMTNNNTVVSSGNHNGNNIKSDKENSMSNGNNKKISKSQQNSKKDNSVKCENCYLRFINEKYLKDHSQMHSDPNDSSRIEMLENAFNPQRSEKILNPIINNSRTQNNINNQKDKSKKINTKNKKKAKKSKKPKVKTYEDDSSSSVELIEVIEVSEPPQIPEHNLSYTQITEALSSASAGLTAIQPVQLLENPHDDDQQMISTELTPLTTITSLTNLTPLTNVQSTEIFQHSENDNSISQSHQHLETSNSMELTSLEPSTISEATKLSLTLLEPSALSELTAFSEPSCIPIHSSNLTDLNLSYVDHSGTILNHEHTVLTEFTTSTTSMGFETQLITTQCNSSAMLNSSSASSDYAVTNMDTSLITQRVKKPRISDSNIHLETFSTLNDNLNQSELKSQITNFPTFDNTTTFLLSAQTPSDHNMAFADMGLSTKSVMSDSTSLEPLTYSDSMPLSEATTILELTSSSHPTSSSEATAFSESNNLASTLLSSSGKKKRNSGGKQLQRVHKPNEKDLLNLEGDFETCSENNHFKCTLCRRAYDVWNKFRKHNEYHTLRPYQCPICPCNFRTNEELLEHNKAHESTKNNYSCDICNRVFISKSRLKAHSLTVHTDERQFKCDYCPSAFKTKSRLVDHVRCHTGEKPIKCHYCDEHFSRATYRLKHERAIHPELLEIDTKHREEKQMEKKNSKEK